MRNPLPDKGNTFNFIAVQLRNVTLDDCWRQPFLDNCRTVSEDREINRRRDGSGSGTATATPMQRRGSARTVLTYFEINSFGSRA
jgi:hypothetical protein